MKNRELDPRLRRMVQSAKDVARMQADVSRGIVARSLEPPEEMTAETVTTRVLVRLESTEPPEGWSDTRWNKIVEGIYATEVPISRLEDLGQVPQVQYVEAGREMSPVLDTSVPETRADVVHAGPPGLDGTDVVVGVVDFGFDFTLDDFRNADGTTRVAFLWDQFLTPIGNEQSPANFGYGVEYDRADIDAALQANDPFQAVRHRPAAGSHGTHVAGTAVGNGRTGDAGFPAGDFVGTAPGATIIFVQPSSSDQDTTFTDSVRVAEAIAYVYQKANELGRPCVVNMSLGQNGGSHDGESVVERAIDRLLEEPGRTMTVAAGNEHIWRGHASGQLETADTRILNWRFGGGLPLPTGGTLQPGFGDFTPNEMEIWYSSRDVLRVRVTDPSGASTPFVEQGETIAHSFNTGDVAFIDSERFTVLNGDARVYIEISNVQGSVATGGWQVEIEAVEIRSGRFDAWIERDARRRANRFADQSFFMGTDFDEVMTLGTPATMHRGIAVANYDHVVEVPNSSSGRGRTRDGRDKPEIAAPGTNILSSNALAGRPDPASPNSMLPARVGMSGTSMAAPHVAGIAALLLQLDGRLTADQVRKILIASANPPAGVQPFDLAWGYGRIDAEAAVDLLT